MPMENARSALDRALAVAETAAGLIGQRQAAIGAAERELRLAANWHLHRAAQPGSIDNAVYAQGSAEQCLDGLDLDPIALLGLKAAGAIAYGWLVEAAAGDPGGSFVDHARAVFADHDRYVWCAEFGAYHRFKWKSEVYLKEVTERETKPIMRDPNAPWRRRSVTVKQRYLIEMMVECLAALDPACERPAPANRGEAHAWLKERSANPIFWHPPLSPAPFVRKK